MSIQVTIPFKTPSVNHLYSYNRYSNVKFMKPEAKELKAKIIELCEGIATNELMNCPLKCIIEINENWRYKNGQIKRSDVSNREKFLIDAVFEGLELDDKWIFEQTLIKKQNEEKEFAVISIELLKE